MFFRQHPRLLRTAGKLVAAMKANDDIMKPTVFFQEPSVKGALEGE